MNITYENNLVIISNYQPTLDLDSIADSGQCFRWKKLKDN